MDEGFRFLFFSASCSSLIMMLITFFKYIDRNILAFKYLAQFLGLMLISITVTYFLRTKAPAYFSLSCLTWILPLVGAGRLIENIMKEKLRLKWGKTILVGGAALCVLLQFLNSEPKWIILPMAISSLAMGLYFFIDMKFKKTSLRFRPIKLANSLVFLGYLLSRLGLIFIINQFGVDSIIMLDSAFLLYFSLALYPMLSEEIFENHEKLLESAIEARNEQLFNHTNLSEFKILSAGVVHEINNALTIINAKVEQMLRINKEPDQEKGLRLILNSANRVNKSVKGLREFIYPDDTWENIEMEELMNHVLVIYGQRLKNHDVTLRLKGFKGKHINGNRIQIEQVVLSLLNHAVEELDKIDERWIEITASKQRTNLELVFCDSGPELSSNLVNILEAAALPIDHDVNEGIRMIQAKKIIEHHSGSLKYENRSGNQVCIIKIPLSSQLERFPQMSSKTMSSKSTDLH